MTRKARSDSIDKATKSGMMKAPDVPDHITVPPDAMPTWHSIVRARDYASWTAIDLEHAANLACCLADLERLRGEVRAEGDTIENQRGTPIVNPKHNLIEVLSRRSVALSRLLHVHAEATSGESRHQAKRSEKQREMQSVKDEADDLIARPVH
jgi:hypothetical protein